MGDSPVKVGFTSARLDRRNVKTLELGASRAGAPRTSTPSGLPGHIYHENYLTRVWFAA